MPILTSQSGNGDAVLRVLASANEVFVVAGNVVSNSSAQSFVTAKDASENLTVTAVRIKKILYNSDRVWTIGRVQNSSSNVVMFSLAGYGQFCLDTEGMVSNGASELTSCNLYCNCSGANGTLMIKLGKVTVPSQDFDNPLD